MSAQIEERGGWSEVPAAPDRTWLTKGERGQQRLLLLSLGRAPSFAAPARKRWTTSAGQERSDETYQGIHRATLST